MNINKVMIAGGLTRDPEVRHTPKGNAVTEMGMALTNVYTSNGERREETTYVDVTLWGKGAELAGKHLKKGSKVYVEGRLALDTWEDKQTGQKRSKLRITGENFQFVGPKKDTSQSTESSPIQNQPDEDDIPF